MALITSGGWLNVPVTTILSIQSSVAYGHAGNSAAVFPMQRMGVDVISVYTVHFSNHTGYGAWRGPHLSAADVRDVVTGVAERGALEGVDAVLSGYMGTDEMGAVITDAVKTAKERSPHAIYSCDPVMGDVGRGFFVLPGIPEYFRDQVVPLADVMTPNQFELDFLTGRETKTLDDVLAAADALAERGPRTVLVTSAVTDQTKDDELTMVVRDDEGCWQVTTPKLDQFFVGSGDFTAATFLVHLLKTGSAAKALEATASIVYSVLEHTTRTGRSELQLVGGQEDMVHPRHTFTAVQVR